jgi:hypothetical protein
MEQYVDGSVGGEQQRSSGFWVQNVVGVRMIKKNKAVEVSVRVRVQEKCDSAVAETVLLGFRAV